MEQIDFCLNKIQVRSYLCWQDTEIPSKFFLFIPLSARSKSRPRRSQDTV